MLIGISGKIGNGKNLFADLLSIAIYSEFHNIPATNDDIANYRVTAKMVRNALKIEERKFADALKDIVCRLTGCTREQLEDQDFKNSAMDPEWNHTWEEAKEFLMKRGDTDFTLLCTRKHDMIIEACKHGWILYRTYREFLQELGTNVFRNWILNIHVNATFSTWKPVPVPIKDTKISGWGGKKGELEVQKEVWPKWFITDMRFPNELVGVKERDGITIRINRETSDILKERRLRPEHESETALDDYKDWDAIIDNNGTIEDLYQQAVKIVKQFKLT